MAHAEVDPIKFGPIPRYRCCTNLGIDVCGGSTPTLEDTRSFEYIDWMADHCVFDEVSSCNRSLKKSSGWVSTVVQNPADKPAMLSTALDGRPAFFDFVDVASIE